MAAAPPNYNCIKFCHVNSQSLLPHFFEFQAFFSKDTSYDIIALSETWLKPHVSDSLVQLDGYHFFRHDRLDKGGGGIGCYIRNGLTLKVLALSPASYCGQPEYFLAGLSGLGLREVLLAVVYRPP